MKKALSTVEMRQKAQNLRAIGLVTSRFIGGVIGMSLLASCPALGQGEGELPEDQRVGRYSSETSENGFVLDRTGELARLQFTSSQEIVQLEMIPGPRGDTFFKDDCGTTVLRLTTFGGATVFDPTTQKGEAFGWVEDADPLNLSAKLPTDVRDQSTLAFQAFNAEFGLDIQFDADWNAGDAGGFGAATLGNAVDNTLNALRRLARDDVGREVLAEQIARVSLETGAASQVKLSDDNLIIYYVWGQGVEGRPSSAAISCFLESNL